MRPTRFTLVLAEAVLSTLACAIGYGMVCFWGSVARSGD